MSLTVRLQGLPPNADSIHVRNFFPGLKIPTGGVKIVGGVDGEAFVRFQKKICVDLALKRSGKHLMGFPVHISVAGSQQNSNRQKTKAQHNPGYLRISFRPLDAKLSHVKRYFKGLSVESVIFLYVNKVRNGHALVKFGKIGDMRKILFTFQLPKNSSKGHKKQNAFSVLSVKRSHQKEWISFGGKSPGANKSKQAGSSSKWLPEISSNDRHLVYIREFYARLLNVSLRAEKSHIRKFLHDLVDDSQITFLCDKNGSRLRECFVMFVTESDYVRALELDKAVLKGRTLRVMPISKENMMELIERTSEVVLENPVSEEEEEMKPEVKYLYLRNFAASVNKSDVLNFFTGFSLTDKDICLLYDDNGDSLGEALVRLSTEEASRAEKLNHKRFQDTEILLRCISEEQLKVFGVDCFLDRSTAKQEFSKKELRGTGICVSEADDGI